MPQKTKTPRRTPKKKRSRYEVIKELREWILFILLFVASGGLVVVGRFSAILSGALPFLAYLGVLTLAFIVLILSPIFLYHLYRTRMKRRPTTLDEAAPFLITGLGTGLYLIGISLVILLDVQAFGSFFLLLLAGLVGVVGLSLGLYISVRVTQDTLRIIKSEGRVLLPTGEGKDSSPKLIPDVKILDFIVRPENTSSGTVKRIWIDLHNYGGETAVDCRLQVKLDKPSSRWLDMSMIPDIFPNTDATTHLAYITPDTKRMLIDRFGRDTEDALEIGKSCTLTLRVIGRNISSDNSRRGKIDFESWDKFNAGLI